MNKALEQKILAIHGSKLRFSKLMDMAPQNVYKMDNLTIETFVKVVDVLRLNDVEAMKLMRDMVNA